MGDTSPEKKAAPLGTTTLPCALGFRVQGSGFRVLGSVFMVQGPGSRVQGSGFRVQGSGLRPRRDHI